jgi:ABC1 atypical kinase-like domain
MLTAASTKLAAQWATQKCTHVVSQLSGHSTTTTLTPIILAAGTKRCFASPAKTYSSRYYFNSTNSATECAVGRIHQNVARLYARRVLELAAASAAVQRFMVQLEAKQHYEPPIDWKNWERREWSQELLESLGDTKVSRLWSATKRIVSMTCLIAPFTVLYPLSLVSDSMEALSWKYALWGIEQAGPTYIKLFQWATTRQDLFSPEFCRYFGKLQDETVGHSWKETVKILEQDLGLPAASDNVNESISNVNEYLELHKTPIGSGCIAQVYRGRLKRAVGQYEEGTEVAVKVQHPGIWHKVCVDFYIMGLAARWLESVPVLNLKYLSLADSVRKFRDIMLPQLDLTLEAKHLQRFNRDFSNDSTVSFPEPLTDLTSTRVLTETFVHGTPILQYVTAPEADRKELALLGLNTTLKMIFLNDFLHGTLLNACADSWSLQWA